MKKLAILLVLLLLTGCFGQSQAPIDEEPPEPNETQEDVIVELTISSVGDIMVHSLQYQAAYVAQTGEYDFTGNFKYIKPYIEKADLAIGNLETTFAGPERGYSGYPMFNTPDSMADAIKFAGFDVISTINNHTIDTGIQGMLRTLDILRDRNLIPVGSKSSQEEKSYTIQNVNGVMVGVTGYSYESPSNDGIRRLNGIPIPTQYEEYLDTFDYDEISRDLGDMENRIESMRQDGAEIIVFVIHWGNEYHRSYNSHQQNLAENLNALGVDVIFGSHPHVIQPVKVIEGGNGHKTLVAYSLGNFISNQRYEFLNNRLTEDGMVVYVTFEKNMTTGKITMKETSYLPTWVNRHVVSGKWLYEIIPVYQAIQNPEKYNLISQDSKNRASISLDNTVNWIKEHNSQITQITTDLVD